MDIVTYGDSYRNIFGCKPFVREKAALYKKDANGGERYSEWLDRQLRFLDMHGIDCVLSEQSDAFEKLSGVPEGMYSITYRNRNGAGNPRVLFFMVEEDGEDDDGDEEEESGKAFYVLLTAFKETSKGSYQKAIKTAKARRKSVLQEIEG